MNVAFWKALFFAGLLSLLSVATTWSSPSSVPETRKATFAGGCFWCMESEFGPLAGVLSAVVGYTGGQAANPSYEEVSSGRTGHYEAMQVTYDPKKISYERLLQIYWENIDPTQADGQFADRGSQYRTAIFYHDEIQRKAAEKSRAALAHSGKFDKPIVTDILPATAFYPAEDHHQAYYRKNPTAYKLYKAGSGRASFIHRVWGEK